MLVFFSGYPLIEILSKSLVLNQVSNFSLIVIVIWLIIILISSIIYFVSYWMEKFDQLHFKGAVILSPRFIRFEAYVTVQVCIKSQLRREVKVVLEMGTKMQEDGGQVERPGLQVIYAIWTCSSVGQSNRLIIWRSQVQTLAGPQKMIPCIYKSRIVNIC